MTGDGVERRPVASADVGVAMGRNGTGHTAAMVADRDKLRHPGRGRAGAASDSVRKFILFMLLTNGGEALVVFFAVIRAAAAAFTTAAQIAWINLVTSGTLGLALAFEPTEACAPPRPARIAAFGPFMARGPWCRCSLAGASLRAVHRGELSRGSTWRPRQASAPWSRPNVLRSAAPHPAQRFHAKGC